MKGGWVPTAGAWGGGGGGRSWWVGWECLLAPDFGNLGHLIKTSPDFSARPVL